MTELAEVLVERAADVVVARLSGEVDLTNVEAVSRDLVAAVGPDDAGLVVSVDELRYLDSAGIRMLFVLQQDLSGHDQRLRVVAAESAPVHRLLEITGARAAVPIDADVATAVSRLAAGDAGTTRG